MKAPTLPRGELTALLAHPGLTARVTACIVAVAVAIGVAAWPLTHLAGQPGMSADLPTYLWAGRMWSAGGDPAVHEALESWSGQDLSRWVYPSWTLPFFADLGRLGDARAQRVWEIWMLLGTALGAGLWAGLAAARRSALWAATAMLVAHAALFHHVEVTFALGHISAIQAVAVPLTVWIMGSRTTAGAVGGGVLLTLAGAVRLQGLAYLVVLAGARRRVLAAVTAVGTVWLLAVWQLLDPQRRYATHVSEVMHLPATSTENGSTLTVAQLLTGRLEPDLVSGAAYLLMVAVFVALPVLVGRRRGRVDLWVVLAITLTAQLVFLRRMPYDWHTMVGAAGCLVALYPRSAWWLVAAWVLPALEPYRPFAADLTVWAAAFLAWVAMLQAGLGLPVAERGGDEAILTLDDAVPTA